MQPTERQLTFIREFQRKERSWVGVQITPLSNGALEIYCKVPPNVTNFKDWATGYFMTLLFFLYEEEPKFEQVHFERFSSAFDCHILHIFV